MDYKHDEEAKEITYSFLEAKYYRWGDEEFRLVFIPSGKLLKNFGEYIFAKIIEEGPISIYEVNYPSGGGMTMGLPGGPMIAMGNTHQKCLGIVVKDEGYIRQIGKNYFSEKLPQKKMLCKLLAADSVLVKKIKGDIYIYEDIPLIIREYNAWKVQPK